MKKKYSGIWWFYSHSFAFTFIMKSESRSVLSLLFFCAYEGVDIFHTSTFFFSAKFYMDQILSNLAAD